MPAAEERIRILYVEDNPADIELTLRHMARHAPHLDVAVVSSGREALQRLEAGPFAAVLLDFRLPDTTGLDVLRELIDRGVEIPVLLVTGSGDLQKAVQALKAGAFDYVVKKEGYLEALPAAIEDALARFRTRAPVTGPRVIRVLYAEDSPSDAELTIRHFRARAPQFTFEVARGASEALRRLGAERFDLVILDFRPMDMTGIEAIKEIRERRLKVPVVLVTGHADEQTAAQALKLGALDYIVKRGDYLERLPYALENALIQHHLAEDREALRALYEAGRAVTESLDLDATLHQIAESARRLAGADRAFVWLVDPQDGSLSAEITSGAGAEAFLGTRVPADSPAASARAAREARPIVVPDALDPASADVALSARLGNAALLALPLHVRAATPGVLTLGYNQPRTFALSEVDRLAALAQQAAMAFQNARLYQDLKRSYEDLRRSQDLLLRQEKMAALGRLASGLAHELNNPLAAIAGFAERLAETANAPGIAGTPPFADFPRRLRQIAEQAFRCGDLVHRLLTYARQREPQSKPEDLWQIVEDCLALMAAKVRPLGDRFEAVRGSGSLVVLADPNMLQQVVINLLTNAIDAVEGGGNVRVAASRREDRDSGKVFIVLELADTGMGIAPDTLPRLFDPFFTTKGERGTGLGLPICQSIVEQHGGTLEVRSPGSGLGATATVRLPAAR